MGKLSSRAGNASRGRLRQRSAETAARRELDRIREPLFREVERLRRDPDYLGGTRPHVCCTRRYNQMRISPLEAAAIAQSFRNDPDLQRKLPEVLKRLRAELRRLKDNDERQSFDCPLLDGTRCLVHQAAKPIGCTAWHPPQGAAEPRLHEARTRTPGAHGFRFTFGGWRAFAERDRLNDELYGREWKLRVIPLWLKRVFARELTEGGGRRR